MLQRVASIITAAGGTISSSEVVPQSTQAKNDHVKVTVSCELEQSKLQQGLLELGVALEIATGRPLLNRS